MGLDCYVVATIGGNDTEKEIGYFRKNWNLHHWMIEYHTDNGGTIDMEYGGNGQHVELSLKTLALLASDIILKQGHFSEIDQYDTSQILSQLPDWVDCIDDGFEVFYYGSY